MSCPSAPISDKFSPILTVGGPAPSAASPDPEGKMVVLDRTTHVIVNELTGAAFTGEPHAIWATPGGKLYVGHERGNRVTVIDTGNANDPLDDTVEGTVSGSSEDLKFLKKPIDIVISP